MLGMRRSLSEGREDQGFDIYGCAENISGELDGAAQAQPSDWRQDKLAAPLIEAIGQYFELLSGQGVKAL